MNVLTTPRLRLRWLHDDDASFILRLVNEPSWLRHIGDKGVRTLEDARSYVRNGPRAMCERLGFGLFAVDRKEDGRPIGICGLIRRDTLPDVDLGFALLPEFEGAGYAYEAADAVLRFGRDTLGLDRIVAIVAPGNARSTGLLRRLGFRHEGDLKLTPDAAAIGLYALEP